MTIRPIIVAALDADPKIPDETKRAVLDTLDGVHPRTWIGEGAAAEILGISRSSLYLWRTGKSSPPFPFLVYTPPMKAGLKYDRAQVVAYVEEKLKQDAAT